jgi:phosphate acyltransferase
MTSVITIGVDVMGGDNAPSCVIAGISDYIKKSSDVKFRLFGDADSMRRELEAYPELNKHVELIHCNDVVKSNRNPVRSYKSGKETSMYKAVMDVKENNCDVCISSGDTGTLMVMATMILGTMPQIKRPALVSIFPNEKQGSVMLDFGANTENEPLHLLQFAVMGHCFTQVVRGIENPTIGILNIGVEEYKGREIDRKAAELLKQSTLNFKGFIEGYDIAKGTVDIIVTDGFSGNIALKVAEGTANTCLEYMRRGFASSWISKIGGFLAKPGIKKSFDLIDPRNYNGAMFIGVNGIVVKSHGSADAYSFCKALEVAEKVARNKINDKLSQSFDEFHASSSDESITSRIKKYIIDKVSN